MMSLRDATVQAGLRRASGQTSEGLITEAEGDNPVETVQTDRGGAAAKTNHSGRLEKCHKTAGKFGHNLYKQTLII